MSTDKHDIQSEADIVLMVDTFYDRVNKDDLLSNIFNNVAQVDWQAHLPKMYRFWNTLIFGAQSYKGAPFDAHVGLPVDATHFDRWVLLFEATLDDLFQGEVTEQTKLRARSIAHVFQSKLAFLNQQQ
ncbi:MAG: group III truncated hemoglobin [Cytophagaceae bacterium]